MKWKAVFIPASENQKVFEKFSKLEINLVKQINSFTSVSKGKYDILTYFHDGTDWKFKSFMDWN